MIAANRIIAEESPPTTEKKFAILRCMIDNKDTLLVQDMKLEDTTTWRSMKSQVESHVRKNNNVDGTLQWIGVVEAWQLLRGPIKIK